MANPKGHGGDGRFQQSVDFTLLEQTNITGDTNGPWVEVGDAHTLRLDLDVTGGTFSTLDVDLETSDDQSETWIAGSFVQSTGTGLTRKGFSGLGKFVRAVMDLDGGATDADLNIKGLKIES